MMMNQLQDDIGAGKDIIVARSLSGDNADLMTLQNIDSVTPLPLTVRAVGSTSQTCPPMCSSWVHRPRGSLQAGCHRGQVEVRRLRDDVARETAGA